MEGGEEEPSTLGTVWYYAWEYGLEVVPVAAPTRGFVRAYNEGSTLGMGLSAIELGSDLSGIGPLMRGGKLAVKGTVKGIGKVASEVKPLASAAIDVAKTKAGQAYSFAKSKAGDAATWMSETSDSVVGGLAGTANWMYSGAAGFFGRRSAGNTGKLIYNPGLRTWTSQAGLVYGEGSVHGNRVKHVLDHLVTNPNKPNHSIFNVGRSELIGLIDEAWGRKVGTGVQQANGNRAWKIDMGRVVGTNGEQHIMLIIKNGTTNVISAFPVFGN